MAGLSWMKGYKKKKPSVTQSAPPVPRALVDINAEYSKVACDLGVAQYQIKALEHQVNEYCRHINALKLEGDAAVKLQAETKRVVAEADAAKAKAEEVLK